MKRKTIDRRQEPRVEAGNPALVSIRGRTPITDAPAEIIELSPTGLRLRMSIVPPKHRMAHVRVERDGVVHTVAGRVVRVEPASEGGHDVGIEFDLEGVQGKSFLGCALGAPPADDKDPVDDKDRTDD